LIRQVDDGGHDSSQHLKKTKKNHMGRMKEGVKKKLDTNRQKKISSRASFQKEKKSWSAPTYSRELAEKKGTTRMS